jgi:hypothetical protein
MVSVNQIEEKNKMSEELKKHGMAVNFEDAFKQAEEMYDTGESDTELVRIRERLNRLESQVSSRDDASTNSGTDKKVVDKINEIVKAINLIEKNQQSFQRQLNELKNAQQTDATTQSAPDKSRLQASTSPNEDDSTTNPEEPSRPSSNQPTQPTHHGSSQEEPSSSSPPSGADPQAYSAEDVAVESIFYSGES